MSISAQLLLLKADLGLMRISPEQQQFFSALLAQSAAELRRKGIPLADASPEDDTLTAAFAAWKYRVRTQAAAPGLPEYLRCAIRDRQIQEAARREAADV